jgi:putative peptidoglycan lipid II flippase
MFINPFSAGVKRIQNMRSGHHVIARNMTWVALFVFFGFVAKAGKEIAIAHRYGVSLELDAYFFVFNLVSWPATIILSILTATIIPVVARIRQLESGKLPHFRSELLGLALMLGLIFVFLGWLGLPLLLHSSWAGLPSTTATLATQMVPSLVLIAPLSILISLFSVWMLAAERQSITLLESLPALVLILILFFFPVGEVQPLVWGTLVGFVIHLIILVIHLLHKGEIETPKFTQQSSEWSIFWQGFGIVAVGQVLMGLTTIVDQILAAHLGIGAIASLNYANRTLSLLLGLGGIMIVRATLPAFSNMQAQGFRQLRRFAYQWAGFFFVIGMGIMIGGWLLAPWGIRIVFEHGAFTSDNTEIVATIFRYGLLQLPFYFTGLVLVSLLLSQQRYWAICLIGAINLVVKIISSLLIVPYFGIYGLMISTTIMVAISTLLLIVVVHGNFFKESEQM